VKAWIRGAGLALAVVVLLWLGGLFLGLYGHPPTAGEPAATPVPAEVRAERARSQRRAARTLTPAPVSKQILFGDLHVHTTFSNDAFVTSLPLLQGGGAHPVADACDFARHCSALDFWSINDHAESLTPRTWRQTREAIRACNARVDDPADPDVVAFLGWEWSQVGRTPEEHYGHKNVILRDQEEGAVPVRPIAAAGNAEGALRTGPAIPRLLPLADLANRRRYYDYLAHLDEIRGVPDCPPGVDVRELPGECFESTATPEGLFEKLAQWGFPVLVVPHGTAWGFYTPPGSSWDVQLSAARRGDGLQRLIEVHSSHGNSEEHRTWREVDLGPDGEPTCAEPTPGHLTNCWRAGEIIGARCLEAGLAPEVCAERAAEARRRHAEAGVAGHRTVPGEDVADWLDAGQCRDCFLPTFDHRPGMSVQYALARRSFEGDGPEGFRFGFIASSDDHKARPGTGYKEFKRVAPGETPAAREPGLVERLLHDRGDPEPRSRAVDLAAFDDRPIRALHHERVSRFMLTGALAAVHATGRDRGSIWEALERREVYGTSGDRILLWFHLLNGEGPDGRLRALPMGAEARMARAPRFEVRAVGAFEQRPGCPDHAVRALGPEGVASLCRGECHHPADRRHRITRIEVVRIRPQIRPDEDPTTLIEDPWRVLPCTPASESGCVVQLEDPSFVEGGRDALYYVRAIQEPTPAVGGDPLHCERDAEGRCLEASPCPAGRDCLAPIEERAWSSPIFVDFAG